MAVEGSRELERPEVPSDPTPAADGALGAADGDAVVAGSALFDSVREHVQTPLFRNAYALIVNTGITAILGFAYWVAAARLFDTKAVGLAAAAISAMTLLAGLALFNLEAVMVRFIPIAGTRTRRLAGSVYALSGVAAVVVATLFILGLDYWEPTLGFLTEQAWGAWFIVATVAWMIFVLQDGILVGLGRAIWVPVENAIFGVGKLGLLLVLAGGGPLGIFASWTIAATLVVVPFTALIFLRFIPIHMRMPVVAVEPLSRERLRQYATGDYVGAMFDLAAISLLPLLVTHWAGPEETAFFYQSWIIAYTLILVANNTARALTVEAAKDQAQLHSYGRVVFGHTLKLLTPAVVAIMLLAPLLLSVFGQDYAAGGTLTLRVLALSAIPHTVVLMALVTARLQHRLGEVIAIQAVTAILILGTALALVGTYGGLGAAIAWLGGQTVVAAVLLATRVRWLVS
jgi:O-antigen/teichoic acid export membrane protein